MERELEKAKSEVAYARNEVKRLCETAKTHEQQMQDFQQRLQDCTEEKQTLKKKCNRAAVTLARVTLKNSRTFTIIQKGIYTAQAQAIARFLVRQVIQAVTHKMSQRTVQCCITEGGIAAKIQVADEMSNTYRDTPKLRILGVDSSLKGLQLRLDECADLFNASPLALRKQTSFSRDEFITKLPDQKKDHALLCAWKGDVRNQQLREKHIAKLPVDELIILLMAEKEKKIDELGGIAVWENLIPVDQLCHDKEILLDLSHELGGGCCMHKDLNTVKGGDKAMSEFWKNSDLTPPVLLANKDNAAVLALARPGSSSSAAEIHAEKVSGCGGDDKKRQQDTFSWFFSQRLGQEVAYPGTKFILLHQDLLIEFMDHICHNKEKAGLTNLKKNFLTAIEDSPTITELLMLLAYSLVSSHPYMRYVHGPGLGPLHQKITQHYEKIIADPDLVIGPKATSATGTFDGKPWHNENMFKVVQEWIFIAFMKGCLVTWIRFTSEFKAGGMIDGLTAEEREAAWMPATNDVNEGALGTLRITMRRKPCLTLHQFNNETQEWMDKELTKEDHAYIHCMARDLDKSKPELKQKSEQEQKQKKKKIVENLRNIVLVLEEDKIQRLGVKAIKEQLDVYHHYDSTVPIKARLNKTGPEGQRERVNTLLGAIERMRASGLTDPRPKYDENTSESFEGTSSAVGGDYIYILEEEKEKDN
ncbi:hypothetical protein EV421DRAFT_1894230 [Armillaria borealis]|uniref:Uncharacterized protein n=1 Tax=Armillaria borealis TaxID=47425 RepID=A0AA39IEQ2_9AGAR|nr:hypothetical protein EV421DRAFT_1894230 [Armillaria borealis]